jgi:hypothetical protein
MSDWSPTIKSIKGVFDEDIFKSKNILTTVAFKFKATVFEDVLGTVPKDKQIYETFIASKMSKIDGIEKEEKEIRTAEEVETVEEELAEKGWTGFHHDEKGIFIYNYMILGNIKANLQLLNNNGSIKKVTSYKKACDTCIKVYPRRVRFKDGNRLVRDPHGSLERPLRAMTNA